MLQNAPLGAFCILTSITLPFSIKTWVLSIFKWPLKTGLTVRVLFGLMLYIPVNIFQSCWDIFSGSNQYKIMSSRIRVEIVCMHQFIRGTKIANQ